MLRELTVKEILTTYARLRLPRWYTRAQTDAVAADVQVSPCSPVNIVLDNCPLSTLCPRAVNALSTLCPRTRRATHP